MTTRPGPAPERGGTPLALNALRKNSGLKKARNTSVIADMTRVEEEESKPAQLHAVQEPAPEPDVQAPAAPVEQQAADVPAAPQRPAYEPAAAASVPVYDQLAPQQPVTYTPPAQQVQLRQPAPEPPVVEKKVYRKTSFFQTKESGARMRSAYMATRHLTGARTLSDFILVAVEREVEALERQYNGGNLFTADPDSVPRGRPLET